jgi:hypothetical protein
MSAQTLVMEFIGRMHELPSLVVALVTVGCVGALILVVCSYLFRTLSSED